MGNKKAYTKKVIITDEKSSPEARAARLRRIRNMANLTREQMCENSSLNINTFKGWEIARYGGLPKDGAERVVSRVAREGVVCTVDWLLYEIGVGPYVLPDYQIAQQQKLNNTKNLASSNEEEKLVNELILFRKQFKETIDCQVIDDGLFPFYAIGDYVAGIKKHGDQITKLIGQNCIIQTSDGKTFIRNLKAGIEPGKYMLVCTNSQTTVKTPVLYEVSLASAALIIRHYKKDIK